MKKRKSKAKKSAPSTNGLEPGENPILQLGRCFDDDELLQLRTLCDEQAAQGEISSDAPGLAADKIRRSQVYWLDRKEHEWVYKKLWKYALEANSKYQFDIDAFKDKIQISVYDESEEGFYTWHTDNYYHMMVRKISLSVPLNGPAEYEGGALQFRLDSADHYQAPQAKGVVLAFPSFVLHRVTPVTKGRRYSLVAWVFGPSFR